MGQYLRVSVLLTALVLASGPLACADTYESEKHSFRIKTLAGGLEHPWSMAFLPDGKLLITERPGRIRILEDGRLLDRPVGGVPEIRPNGQGGLLDVAAHPDFERNRLIYFTYSGFGEGGWSTELARARLDELANLEGVEVLFRAEPRSSGGRHFGSRIVFDGSGHVYFGMGDRGERNRAQDLSDHAGSIYRLMDDGRVPSDNPLVNRPNARPEIYAYGIRNPQGLIVHPETGELWEHEHGPMGGDELNVIRAGRNYGWPTITFGRAYTGFSIGEGTSMEGMEQPLYYWVPSIAPSGMSYYSGNRFSDWRGNLFIGSLKFALLVRLELEGETVVSEERLLQGELGRIRDVRQGPDGLIYLLTDAPDGVLARLEPAD